MTNRGGKVVVVTGGSSSPRFAVEAGIRVLLGRPGGTIFLRLGNLAGLGKLGKLEGAGRRKAKAIGLSFVNRAEPAVAVGKVQSIAVNNVGYGEGWDKNPFGKEIAEEKAGEEDERGQNNFYGHLFILAKIKPLQYNIVTSWLRVALRHSIVSK